MKHLLWIFYALITTTTSAQTGWSHYLVFTFNRVYHVEGYASHITGDHMWIVPVDSCKDSNFERFMKPLFVANYQLEDLEDSTILHQGFGEFPVYEHSRKDSVAWTLYKNRHKIQEHTIKYSYPKSKDLLTIYCVPIMAQCSTHKIGYYNTTVMTIDSPLLICTSFWKEEKKEKLRILLHHDFSHFDYIVSLSNR